MPSNLKTHVSAKRGDRTANRHEAEALLKVEHTHVHMGLPVCRKCKTFLKDTAATYRVDFHGYYIDPAPLDGNLAKSPSKMKDLAREERKCRSRAPKNLESGNTSPSKDAVNSPVEDDEYIPLNERHPIYRDLNKNKINDEAINKFFEFASAAGKPHKIF